MDYLLEVYGLVWPAGATVCYHETVWPVRVTATMRDKKKVGMFALLKFQAKRCWYRCVKPSDIITRLRVKRLAH